jgi:hypothetical protein
MTAGCRRRVDGTTLSTRWTRKGTRMQLAPWTVRLGLGAKKNYPASCRAHAHAALARSAVFGTFEHARVADVVPLPRPLALQGIGSLKP